MAAASVLTCVGFVAPARTASAASFDCAKAAISRERAICADKHLSDLDSQVGQLYKAALAQLSPAGAERLRSGERAWLAYLGQACPTPSPQLDSQKKTCLSSAYADRVADLKLAAVRSGPYLFTRTDAYSAEKPPAQTRAGAPPAPELGLNHFAAPQIDGPATPVTAAWNRLAMSAMTSDSYSDCGPGEGDRSLSYSLGLATSRLISVTWTDWEYCHGMAHGHGGNHVQSLILTPTPRPLKAEDLFQSGKPWKEKLAGLLLAEAEKAARDEEVDPAHLDRTAIAAAAAKPDRWSLRQDGLGVAFDPYELGEGYPFAPDVTVPWSALTDVLAGDPTRP